MDYSKTKIYKIWSPLGDKIYIGATTKKYLSERLVKHRKDYRQWKEEKRGYTTSFILFDEYGVENCNIELIEAKECSDKDEQKKIEGFYIRSLVCVNKIIPNRTNIEYKKMYNPLYREKNKEALQKKDREYHHEHKEKRNAYNKEYYKENREAIIKKNTEYHQEHKEKRDEYAKEYAKEYYKKNREAIIKRNGEYAKLKKIND